MLTTDLFSFGFGGTNAHCILEEYTPSTRETTSTSDIVFTPLLLSAGSESSLREMVSRHLSYLRDNPVLDLRDLVYTLQHRRSNLAYRTFVHAPTFQQVFEALEKVADADLSN